MSTGWMPERICVAAGLTKEQRAEALHEAVAGCIVLAMDQEQQRMGNLHYRPATLPGQI